MEKEVSNRSEHMKEFTNKLAEKLGVPADKVAAAMRDVRKEWMDQMIKDKIQEAVQNGIITPAEAGPIREWVKNRPEGVQKLVGQMFGHMGGRKGMGM
jgi:hypothetical protein